MVSSLPCQMIGRHVDLLKLQAPRRAEQPQILTRPVDAGPQALSSAV